jgi:two-component system, NarL family, nitrate/nitrite response regulator NarL
MPRVIVVAPTQAQRSRLSALAAGPGIEIVGTSATIDAALEAQAASVWIVAGDGLLRQVENHAGLTGVAVVCVVDRAGQLARPENVAGWVLVAATATRGEMQAAVLAADSGFYALPMEWAGASQHVDAVPYPDHTESALDDEPAEELTAREQEVLELLSVGLSNRRIAARLGISEHTAKFHVAAIYGKLGVSSRTAAVNRALRRGILRL